MGELGSEKGRGARARAVHHGTIQEEELTFTHTRADAHSQNTRTKATRGAIRPPRRARRGLTSSPARKWGRRPSAGQHCCLSAVGPLRTTAQQLPQTKSTHPSYLGKLLLGIYLADAHMAKVRARMVTTALHVSENQSHLLSY